MTNAGNFQNQNRHCGSGTEYALNASAIAWHFDTANGSQGLGLKTVATVIYAMAVRPGDVPAVPEPETYALTLAGLAALALALARRRSRRSPGPGPAFIRTKPATRTLGGCRDPHRAKGESRRDSGPEQPGFLQSPSA